MGLISDTEDSLETSETTDPSEATETEDAIKSGMDENQNDRLGVIESVCFELRNTDNDTVSSEGQEEADIDRRKLASEEDIFKLPKIDLLYVDLQESYPTGLIDSYFSSSLNL